MAAPWTAATSVTQPPLKPNADDALARFFSELEALTTSPTQAHLSLPRLIKSCAKSSSAALSPVVGRQLHALSFKLGLYSDLFVQTSLVSLYSARLHYALQVFDRMPHRNVVAWTATINACLSSEQPGVALSLFRQMMSDSGIAPDRFAFVGFLSACAQLGVLSSGRGAHAHIVKTATELTSFVGTALIDMYCKCGSIDDATAVFDSMPVEARSIQTWNAMLHGLSVHGLGAEAVQLFEGMGSEGIAPNEVTFVALLCGCAHAGLVHEGRFYFEEMRAKYGIEPNVKHYGCMVDLLGRAGLLDIAYEMASDMGIPPNHVVWSALLGACRVHGNVSMAEAAMEKIANHDFPAEDTSRYVVMSNMYRKAGLSDKIAGVRAMVGKKPKGKSWIEVGGQVHEFGVGGVAAACSHPVWGEMIRRKLDEMEVRSRGEKSKNWENPHGEVAALAFGLIRTGGPSAIRISKNLRICDDCHEVMKAVSGAYKRDIVVRDCNRFHRFTGGHCSCKDYW